MSLHEAVVAGATGLIGSHVMESFRNDGVRVCGFARKHISDRDVHAGNLNDPRTFSPLLEGAHAAVQAASYLGGDQELSRQTNLKGTNRFIEACSNAGIERIIYVSTTAVYGFGLHYKAGIGQLSPRPASTCSEHRLEAESAVLAAGGCVVRPHLVYGRGDRWVLPAITLFSEAAGGLPQHGKALQSIISASELGNAIARLCRNQPESIAGKIFHAARPQPVSTWEIANTTMKTLDRPTPLKGVRNAYAWSIARSMGFSEHQYDLINNDHWYDPGDFWQACGLSPDSGFELNEDETSWYIESLAPKDSRLQYNGFEQPSVQHPARPIQCR